MWDAVLRRTARVKLAVPDERRDDIKRTMRAFNDAAQAFADHGWGRNDDGYVITAQSRIQALVYADVRESLGSHSDLCVGAANLASASLRSAVERMKAGKRAGKPTFTANSATYNTNAVSYFHEDDTPYCTLAAYNGRVRAEYVLPPSSEDCPQREHLLGDEWDTKGATLHYDTDDDAYYLHVAVERDEPETKLEPGEAENGTVLGVDLGIANIAVTSTGRFFSGGLLNHRRDEYEKVRGSLQRTDTESAHRTLDDMGNREQRWNRDLLHCISKAIVQEALTHDCTVIAFEDLTDIRDRLPGAKAFHGWAFKQLYEYVSYKAEAYGIVTEQINPAYTSQRCSKCGTTLQENRTSQEGFCCQKCGYAVHADYNAAKNIGMRQLRSRPKSPIGGATHHLALKSGTLNGNGSYAADA
jgi:IS605 OrfB family transposase